MAGRKFSLVDYFDVRCADMDPLFRFSAADEVEARKWRGRALAKVRDLLGETPEWAQLSAETIETVDEGSYVREKVIFDSDPHSSVPGYILIPKDLAKPAPTLLCLHGHGPGKDVVAGVTAPDDRHDEQSKLESIRRHNYDYGRQFAEQGYVTFTFDYRCFGERSSPHPSMEQRDPCNVHFIRGALLGINILSLDIHDTIRAVDYLEERPEVDPSRIGCVGLSFGGTMAMWSTAMERRIRATVVSGYLCEFESFAVQMANFCGSQFVPALRRYFDVPDIAALIAPRPLLIQNGSNDEGFPIDSANRAYSTLKRAYQAWGAEENLSHDVFDGGHQFNFAPALRWMNARL